MSVALRPSKLSIALHGVLAPGKPCLWSGFVLDANDRPIGPARSGWITLDVEKPPARRGPKPKVLKNAAVLFAHLCWTNNDRLRRYEADQKACALFGYEDPRSVKKVVAKARKVLPHGLILVKSSGDAMVILFDGFPQIKTIAEDTMTLIGPAFDWLYPEQQARYSEINLTLTTATRIDLERFHVTLRDMAIILTISD